VAVDGWQWQGGSGKKMEGFGPVLTEIWVIDWQWQLQWVAVAVDVAVDGGGSGKKMEGFGPVLREIRMIDDD
jgi:hypothetical protein